MISVGNSDPDFTANAATFARRRGGRTAGAASRARISRSSARACPTVAAAASRRLLEANGHGTAHGGIIFSLADTAFAYACNSRNTATVASQASITYLTPAAAAEVLIAEAEELAVAGRSGSYAVHVFTPEGRPVAEFQGLSRTTGGTVITQSNNEENHG